MTRPDLGGPFPDLLAYRPEDQRALVRRINDERDLLPLVRFGLGRISPTGRKLARSREYVANAGMMYACGYLLAATVSMDAGARELGRVYDSAMLGSARDVPLLEMYATAHMLADALRREHQQTRSPEHG